MKPGLKPGWYVETYLTRGGSRRLELLGPFTEEWSAGTAAWVTRQRQPSVHTIIFEVHDPEKLGTRTTHRVSS